MNIKELNYIYTKQNVSYKEYKIHKYVYGLSEIYGIHVPRPYEYNYETRELKMQKIPNMCISDFYGETSENVPEEIFKEIQKIIILLYNHHVYYPDITGYNFIEYNGHIWILDFGHASICNKIDDPFVIKFMSGLCKWNSDFA
jgi:tRNA A-37 threonylcarbamoyl transferase component Bud32